MKKYAALSFAVFIVVAMGAVSSAQAKKVKKEQTAGTYKLELEVLPPEPFYTESQVKSENIEKGMLVERGAAPVQPKASPQPNHHLVVHVFDKSTGKAVTNANVEMSFQRLGPAGEPVGTSTQVPVVEMQVIGKGPSTTHYGNNVDMPSGTYRVTVTANGATATFKVDV